MGLLGWGPGTAVRWGEGLSETGQAAAMRSDLRDCEYSTELTGRPRGRAVRRGLRSSSPPSGPLLKSQRVPAPRMAEADPPQSSFGGQETGSLKAALFISASRCMG